MNWLEQTARNWLASRGYWVMKASVPTLVISHGAAVVRREADGAAVYEVIMPSGHRVFAVNHTVVVEQK